MIKCIKEQWMLKCSNNSFKSICHLIQKQLPDPGEGALGVDGAGV